MKRSKKFNIECHVLDEVKLDASEFKPVPRHKTNAPPPLQRSQRRRDANGFAGVDTHQQRAPLNKQQWIKIILDNTEPGENCGRLRIKSTSGKGESAIIVKSAGNIHHQGQEIDIRSDDFVVLHQIENNDSTRTHYIPWREIAGISFVAE